MRVLNLLVLMSSCVVALPAFSQENIVRSVAQGALTGPNRTVAVGRASLSFKQALRAGGLAYMVPNKRVGAEALQKGVSSSVGMTKPTFASHLKCKAYEVCARHLTPTKLDALLERQLVQEPFPAYYTSFPKAWGEFQKSVGGKLGTLEVILDAAYGRDALFEGRFLSTYAEVVEFSKQLGTNGKAVGEALSCAYTQGMEQESGFFAIRVQTAEDHPQDVLLLDIKDAKNLRWISLRQSIGGEWMDTHWIESQK